jgi:hypothetical protein
MIAALRINAFKPNRAPVALSDEVISGARAFLQNASIQQNYFLFIAYTDRTLTPIPYIGSK